LIPINSAAAQPPVLANDLHAVLAIKRTADDQLFIVAAVRASDSSGLQ
jgi:hypothetical protein